jgi:hypothetical protein
MLESVERRAYHLVSVVVTHSRICLSTKTRLGCINESSKRFFEFRFHIISEQLIKFLAPYMIEALAASAWDGYNTCDYIFNLGGAVLQRHCFE